MKNILTLFVLSFLPVILVSQTTTDTENWIKTKTYKKDTATVITNPTLLEAKMQIQYFDGLGRPKQIIDYGMSGNGKDLVTHIEYDPYGRQVKEFLPYESVLTSTLAFRPSASTEVVTFYNTPAFGNTQNPYSEKKLENSPLNRILKQGFPGTNWAVTTNNNDHTVKYAYGTNVATSVRAFKAIATWDASTKTYLISFSGNSSSYFAANMLYKTVVYDENTTLGETNKGTEKYTDIEGRVVLERTNYVNTGGGGYLIVHDTYYVYDQFGNLTYVIPPAVDLTANVTQTILDNMCYQYKYDHRNRLVEKKLPGKQWEYIVYDKLDRVRATGPVLSPFTNSSTSGWLITKYDKYNRPVLTAYQDATITSAARKTFQDNVDNISYQLNESKSTTNTNVSGVLFRYTTVSYPVNGYNPLTVQYYDDYLFDNAPVNPTDFALILGQEVRNPFTSKNICKTLPTGEWVRLLETSGSVNGNYLYSLFKKDRMASSISSKTLYTGGGYVKTNVAVDFEGKVTPKYTYHKKTSGSTELVITENMVYTAQSRLYTHKHNMITPNHELLSCNTYDALGRLKSKKVGNTETTPLQKIDYSYNIRGWLNRINNYPNLTDTPSDLFTFKLQYDSTGYTDISKQYNANISETYWKTSTDNKERRYGYLYDDLNRMKNSYYKNVTTGSIYNTYNEGLSYDKNGNITSLQRNGGIEVQNSSTSIDNLTYYYDPSIKNRLVKVIDATNNIDGFDDDGTGTLASDPSNDYAYDAFGNMTKDENKTITAITYDHLNLPLKITFSSGYTIQYIYDALGTKMKKTVTQGSTVNTTEYLNEFQYLNGTLQFIQHAEGYVKYTAGGSSGFYNYVYHIKDHLGNIRVSFTKQLTNNTAKLLKENHYYTFGLKHPYNSTEFDYYYNTSTSSLSIGPMTNSNRYQYNSKEWQNELSLNLYDYGARMFDPAIGRWGVVDPLAEKYQSWSPYNYVYNNPLKFVDPTGMGPEDWYRNNKTGEYVWKEGSGKQKGFTHIGLTRFSSIDNNLFYWRGENDVVAITNENSNRFRLLAIEGGIKESKYGLHIINASIQNRLDKNFEGAENFEDLLTYKQYNAINEPNYINFDKFLDDNYKFNGRKGNEFLEKVKDVLYSNSVDVLKSKYNMKEANLILGYSHNGQSLFGKYRYEITFDKKSTLITNVESSKNTFPDLK
jgi:RHS repeat-associated protein